jgi:hypothetical protein
VEAEADLEAGLGGAVEVVEEACLDVVEAVEAGLAGGLGAVEVAEVKLDEGRH